MPAVQRARAGGWTCTCTCTPSVIRKGDRTVIRHLFGREKGKGFGRSGSQALTCIRLLLSSRRADTISRSDKEPGRLLRDGPTGTPFARHHPHSPQLLAGKSEEEPRRHRGRTRSEIRNRGLGYSECRSIFNCKWKASTFLGRFSGSLVADPRARLAGAQRGAAAWPPRPRRPANE